MPEMPGMPSERKRVRRVAVGSQPALVLVPDRHGLAAPPPPRGAVLVVEDDAPTRAMLELALADGGWRVLPAAGVDAALALARAHRPDAILLDLVMEGSDGPGAGLAFTRAYASLPAPRAPIVLTTAWPISPALVEAVGAAATLPKPFDLDELFSVLDRVTGPSGPSGSAGPTGPAGPGAPPRTPRRGEARPPAPGHRPDAT